MRGIGDTRGNASVSTLVVLVCALGAAGGISSLGAAFGTSIAGNGRSGTQAASSSGRLVVAAQAGAGELTKLAELTERARPAGEAAQLASHNRSRVTMLATGRSVSGTSLRHGGARFTPVGETTADLSRVEASAITARPGRATVAETRPETKPFTIGLDLDGVTGKPTARWLAKNVRAITSAFFRSGFKGGPKAKFWRMHDLAAERGIYRNMGVVTGAPETLRGASAAGAEVHVITARRVGETSKVIRDTTAWLDDANIPHHHMTFTSEKTGVHADVYIDDSVKNIKRYQAEGRTVIIFDRPYNRHVRGLRAKNWSEVQTLVADLQKVHDEGFTSPVLH